MNFLRRRMNLTILADGTAIALGGTRSGRRRQPGDPRGRDLGPDGRDLDYRRRRWPRLGCTTRRRSSSTTVASSSPVARPPAGCAPRSTRRLTCSRARGLRSAALPTAIAYGATFNVGSPDAGIDPGGRPDPAVRGDPRLRPEPALRPARRSPLSGSNLSVGAPSGAGVAPPGFYLLVIKNANGVPSVARHVRIDSAVDLQPGTIAGTVTDAAHRSAHPGRQRVHGRRRPDVDRCHGRLHPGRRPGR